MVHGQMTYPDLIGFGAFQEPSGGCHGAPFGHQFLTDQGLLRLGSVLIGVLELSNQLSKENIAAMVVGLSSSSKEKVCSGSVGG